MGKKAIVIVFYIYLTKLQIFLWLTLLISHSVQEVKYKMEEDGATSTLSLGRWGIRCLNLSLNIWGMQFEQTKT